MTGIGPSRIDPANYHLVQLGCAKNQVDGEVIEGLLQQAGIEPAADPDRAELIVVNTCSFILAASEQSIDAILEEAQRKKSGNCRLLVVTGCLPQHYAEELAAQLPEVDLFIGADQFPRIVELLKDLQPGSQRLEIKPPSYLYDAHTPRIATTPSAYLKIAEGCSNHCGYCIIGRLRGPFRSRSPADIIEEAVNLASSGVRELCLVSQDTTGYGRDLAPPSELPSLLRQLAKEVPEVWIRLLYLHPARITDRLLETMADLDNLCPYLDLPIQHIADDVLKQMRRPGSQKEIEELIERIRRILPQAALRTSLIVGHPGEGRKEFELLLDFVKRGHFDHLGVFDYSPEEGTPSALLKNRVSAAEAIRRRDRIMEQQAVISEQKNRDRIGETCQVLIERVSVDFPDHLESRTKFQAPDVDGLTLVYSDKLKPGDFTRIRIEDATCYDLAGSPIADG